MIAVPSASTGRRGDNIARLRLFAALDRPHPIRMMKDWTKGAASTLDLPIDSAIIQTGQPIYTGRPVFVRSVRTVEGQDRREGVEDPVPRALHAVILPGDRDTVALVIDRFAPKLAAIEAKVNHVARACGSNWRAFLDAAVGDDEGFFIPLTRGIGVAVRAGAHTDEIEATVTTILALARRSRPAGALRSVLGREHDRKLSSSRRRDPRGSQARPVPPLHRGDTRSMNANDSGLGAEAAEIARLSAEYDALFRLNAGYPHPPDDEQNFDDVLAKAAKIAKGDIDEARRLIEIAARFQVDELERDRFLDVVKRRLGAGARLEALRKVWDEAAREARIRATLASLLNRAKPKDDAAVRLEDFVAYMQSHDYIFMPARRLLARGSGRRHGCRRSSYSTRAASRSSTRRRATKRKCWRATGSPNMRPSSR